MIAQARRSRDSVRRSLSALAIDAPMVVVA